MLLTCLIAAAVAGGGLHDSQLTQDLSLEEVGFEPAGEERLASGPELYAAGPHRLAALYDPVRREIVLLPVNGAPTHLSTGRLDDAAFVGEDLLLLDEAARTLTLMDDRGTVLDRMPLPGLVPPGCRLAVDTDEAGQVVRARDVFGNLHRLARVDAQGLSPGDGPALLEAPSPITWDGEALHFEGGTLALPGALAASGQWLDGERGWLMVDEVVSEGPLVVERRFVHSDGELTVHKYNREGAWRPGRDAAVSPEGVLLVLEPGQTDLTLRRVLP